jgi:hypothetical protein
MVETRRSDEPLVETVDPDALARRHGRASGGAVPERGRKQTARSPERLGDSEPRNPSYFEELLAKNGSTFGGLMSVRASLSCDGSLRCFLTRSRCAQAIGVCALISALFTPVPLGDFIFVGAVWSYLTLATMLRFPRKARVEQPGPYPFRPLAAPPIRGFADQHQLMTLTAGVLMPVLLIATSRIFHIKFASDTLREAVASQLFLQLMQFLTEAIGQWPARLAPPVWLTIPALFGAARMRSLINMFGASRGDALFPRLSNWMGFSAFKWAFRRKSSAEWMLALTRVGAISGLAVTLIDVLVALPLVEAPAFMDSRYVHEKPALHSALEPGVGRENIKSD